MIHRAMERGKGQCLRPSWILGTRHKRNIIDILEPQSPQISRNLAVAELVAPSGITGEQAFRGELIEQAMSLLPNLLQTLVNLLISCCSGLNRGGLFAFCERLCH